FTGQDTLTFTGVHAATLQQHPGDFLLARVPGGPTQRVIARVAVSADGFVSIVCPRERHRGRRHPNFDHRRDGACRA
ncbi:MAG: hypothetical protein ACJ8D8_10690, partial [Microvirga sp.]